MHLSHREHSCTLDMVDEHGSLSLADVGELLGGLTRERIRQIEQGALRKLEASGGLETLGRYLLIRKRARESTGHPLAVAADDDHHELLAG